MNKRKLKLDLTIDLINQKDQKSGVLKTVKNILCRVRTETGNLLEEAVERMEEIEAGITRMIYKLRYENCTVNIDLTMNKVTQQQYLNSFDLR